MTPHAGSDPEPIGRRHGCGGRPSGHTAPRTGRPPTPGSSGSPPAVIAKSPRRQTKSAQHRRCGWDSGADTAGHGRARSCRPSNARPARPGRVAPSPQARSPGPCPAARPYRSRARLRRTGHVRVGHRTPSGPANPIARPVAPAESGTLPSADEAVREHHGQRRVLGTDLTDHQRHPVGGGHHAAAVGVEQLEILTGVGIVGGDAPAHGSSDGYARGSAHRGQPGSSRQPAGLRLSAAPPGLVISQRLRPVAGLARYVLVTRPRGLVTTS